MIYEHVEFPAFKISTHEATWNERERKDSLYTAFTKIRYWVLGYRLGS
jgi:hypothetical protein